MALQGYVSRGFLVVNNLVSPDISAVLVGITALGFVTFAAVTMTSFIKIAVVLFLPLIHI